MTVPVRNLNASGTQLASPATASEAGSTPGSPVAVAQAVAEAVRAAEGVVAISPGRGVEAATYGPGKRVVGVVVDRSVANSVRLEVHVVVAQRSVQTGEPRGQVAPALPALADQVRRIAVSAARAAGSTASSVDVFIDDLQ